MLRQNLVMRFLNADRTVGGLAILEHEEMTGKGLGNFETGINR